MRFAGGRLSPPSATRIPGSDYQVQIIVNGIRTEPKAVLPIYLVRNNQSGRLDVRKSGVCGAGLNRNME